MNNMLVNPLLAISPDGPVNASGDLVHVRQGDLDGACGPYCMFMALIALKLMSRDEAKNMDQLDGRTREGRFRDALYAFGVLSSEGSDGSDLEWLTDYFKAKGLSANHIESGKDHIFESVTEAIDLGHFPIIGVSWQGGGAHWMLAVGYQGVEREDDMQLTHLLCLDPGEETPRTSLWNSVLEIYNDDGSSANQGRMSSNHWGMQGNLTKCQLRDTVVVSLNK